MKLSIIVPVYKVERTLERCVESILHQKFVDYELILVDDGSPDGSPVLCDALCERDSRIVVIHRSENGGLSVARNDGIARSSGEYITFIDSDDYVGVDTLGPLMDLLSVHADYDILEYSAYLHFEGSLQSKAAEPSARGSSRRGGMTELRLEDREYRDMHEYWYGSRAYMHAYAWNKIYRRRLFTKSTFFPEGRKFEDVWLLPQLLGSCEVVATTCLGYYYYCHNPEGITSQATGRDMADLLDAHLAVLGVDSDSSLKNPTRAYYLQVLNVALDVYELTGEFSSLPAFRSLDSSDDHGVLPLKMQLLNIFGLKTLCRINKIAHRICRRSR